MIAPFLKGLALGVMLAISVGPVIFSIIKQSINNGYKGGFTFVAGVSASDITLVLMSQLFTALFQELLSYKKSIGICGSILLIALGIYILLFKKTKKKEDGSQSINMRKRDYLKTFLSGFFMNTLNPGVIAFWLIIATSVVGLPFNYRLIMFGTCLVFVLATDVLKVLLAGRLREKLTPHNIHIINRISALILIGFGIALIWGTMEFNTKLL
ncbi:MAG: LysE family translocator [Sphingobacteriia bacterium]|nr:LysE family translocator [Sphingobacteriia bacterium]